MNINRVYLCNICLKTNGDYYGKYAESVFVKKAIVYHKETYLPEFVDLLSGEVYDSFNKYDARIGALYISGRMVPISNTIKSFANRETDNLPKRRVLKISKEIMSRIEEEEKVKEENLGE